MHPINTVKGAITTAFVLAVILAVALSIAAGAGPGLHLPQLDRWLHIVAGVMWIGLLYYFNVVQTPGLAAAADKAAREAAASQSTSRLAPYCGSAGRPWPPGSPARFT